MVSEMIDYAAAVVLLILAVWQFGVSFGAWAGDPAPNWFAGAMLVCIAAVSVTFGLQKRVRRYSQRLVQHYKQKLELRRR